MIGHGKERLRCEVCHCLALLSLWEMVLQWVVRRLCVELSLWGSFFLVGADLTSDKNISISPSSPPWQYETWWKELHHEKQYTIDLFSLYPFKNPNLYPFQNLFPIVFVSWLASPKSCGVTSETSPLKTNFLASQLQWTMEQLKYIIRTTLYSEGNRWVLKFMALWFTLHFCAPLKS